MSQQRLRRARTVAIPALCLVAASTLLGGTARAQTDTDAGAAPALGGFEGSGHASGVHLFYNPDGVLPTAALLDFGAPDALATIASGPMTFARAAIADPGDLLVNPDALLTQADPDYPQGTLPAYPYRISANSSSGEPRAESKPAPGLDASVEATSGGSASEARTPAAGAPGILSAGSLRSTADTTFDEARVQVHARTEVNDLDFLGLLRIESVVTDVVASSTGEDMTVDGGTTITGATFMDQPVIIDEDGIRIDPDADSPDVRLLGGIRDALPENLTKALADAGLRISLPGPVEQDGETTGQMGSTGVRIDFELSERTAPALGDLLDRVPPLENPLPDAPSIEDVLVVVRATHLTALEIGRAEVSLNARPGYVAPPFEAPSTSPALDAPSAPALSPPTARSPEPQPSTAPSTDPVATSPSAASTAPAASLGAGIGALALLALLAQPFIGDRIARAGAAVLATGPTDTCPLMEEP